MKYLYIIGAETPLGIYFKKNLPQEYVDISQDEKPGVCVDYLINLRLKNVGLGGHKIKPFDFIADNLEHELSVIDRIVRTTKVKKIINILPNCIYPENEKQLLVEEDLWSGKCEEIVSYYAYSKKLLIHQSLAIEKQLSIDVQNFIVAAYYGPYDNFGGDSQVIPSLINKVLNAKESNLASIDVWGSGKAIREFIYVDDLAKMIINNLDSSAGSIPINLSRQAETTINDLVNILKELIGYQGKIIWDPSKPEGVLRKVLSAKIGHEKLNLNLSHVTSLKEGLQKTIEWYKNEYQR